MALINLSSALIGTMHTAAWTAGLGHMLGHVANQVMVKPEGEPEHPAAARVLLLRLSDGAPAWTGATLDGNYTADRLVLGAEYVPVGIDPARQYQAVAAGPVRALPSLALIDDRPIVGHPFETELRLIGWAEPCVVTYVDGLPSGLAFGRTRVISGASPAGTPGAYRARFDITPPGATQALRVAVTVHLEAS